MPTGQEWFFDADRGLASLREMTALMSSSARPALPAVHVTRGGCSRGVFGDGRRDRRL